jgi:hypothetical protein
MSGYPNDLNKPNAYERAYTNKKTRLDAMHSYVAFKVVNTFVVIAFERHSTKRCGYAHFMYMLENMLDFEERLQTRLIFKQGRVP